MYKPQNFGIYGPTPRASAEHQLALVAEGHPRIADALAAVELAQECGLAGGVAVLRIAQLSGFQWAKLILSFDGDCDDPADVALVLRRRWESDTEFVRDSFADTNPDFMVNLPDVNRVYYARYGGFRLEIGGIIVEHVNYGETRHAKGQYESRWLQVHREIMTQFQQTGIDSDERSDYGVIFARKRQPVAKLA